MVLQLRETARDTDVFPAHGRAVERHSLREFRAFITTAGPLRRVACSSRRPRHALETTAPIDLPFTDPVVHGRCA